MTVGAQWVGGEADLVYEQRGVVARVVACGGVQVRGEQLRGAVTAEELIKHGQHFSDACQVVARPLAATAGCRA
jgi:hypothetical protein